MYIRFSSIYSLVFFHLLFHLPLNYLCNHSTVRVFVHMSVRLSACISVRLSVCLSFSLIRLLHVLLSRAPTGFFLLDRYANA